MEQAKSLSELEEEEHERKGDRPPASKVEAKRRDKHGKLFEQPGVQKHG